MKTLALIVSLLVLAGIGYAISGNPTSNVLYDSANTAGNLVIRDANGNFATTSIGTAGSTPSGSGVNGVGGTASIGTAFPGLVSYPAYAIGSQGTTGLGVTASTCIPVNSNYETVMPVGNVTLTSLPNISTTTTVGASAASLFTNGMFLVIGSSATETVTFQSSGTLAGSGLALGSTTRVVSKGHFLALWFDPTTNNWLEWFYH